MTTSILRRVPLAGLRLSCTTLMILDPQNRWVRSFMCVLPTEILQTYWRIPSRDSKIFATAIPSTAHGRDRRSSR